MNASRSCSVPRKRGVVAGVVGIMLEEVMEESRKNVMWKSWHCLGRRKLAMWEKQWEAVVKLKGRRERVLGLCE